MKEVNQDIQARSSGAPAEWDNQLTVLYAELQTARQSIEDVDGIALPVYWQWGGGSNEHRTLQRDVFLLNYEPPVRRACANGEAACASSVATAVNVVRAVALSARINQCAGRSRLEEAHKSLIALDKEWNHYFFETRSQYIWELAVNSWRFKDKQDQFARPPKDQIILAHPGVAFEYVGGGAQNERAYEATVLAELIGYNRIRWDDEGKSKLPPLGVSLVATYTPDNTGDHTGYGIMFHAYHTLSLGVTRRDTGAGDETTYLLSMDLMRLVLNPTPEAIEKFRFGKASQ
jgi:hypothetical protein